MTHGAPAIRIDGLRAGYGRGGDIVCGVTLAQQANTILTVIGPNGSGKSTLAKTIAGLVMPRAGSIGIGQQDLTKLSPPQRVAAGLAYVPQENNVFRSMTVAENIRLATEFIGPRSAASGAAVGSLFPELASQQRLLAGNLSGGQRQMLAFACALLAEPDVLLLDEPSAGLSPKFVTDIMTTIQKVRDTGVTVLLIEQNVAAGLAIADQVAVLVGGKIAHYGNANSLPKADLDALFMGQAA